MAILYLKEMTFTETLGENSLDEMNLTRPLGKTVPSKQMTFSSINKVQFLDAFKLYGSSNNICSGNFIYKMVFKKNQNKIN